ncbi:hypothetical protein DPMN_104667 [Dreissena polymorpha]|uniref:Uncharacterized protein n=1 Tax=Dreissena polymorpha TaxID=45954 RepID=A0A9D4HAE6_DREPO|nr:hypothetical protein DPMN_104667 [Dreissena polymorpha]
MKILTRINSPPPWQQRMNLLTKFHEDRKINVASIVLTRKNALPPGGHVFQATEKQALPPGGHVFQPNKTNVELVRKYFGTNVLSKFHEAQNNLRTTSSSYASCN